MAEIWADYLVSNVHYVETYGKRTISKALVHEYRGAEIDVGATWLRIDMMIKIDKGFFFHTIRKSQNGEWEKGERVGKLYINGSYYLKVAGDEAEADDLGGLPDL